MKDLPNMIFKFYSMEGEEVIRQLGTAGRGLSNDEAAKRLLHYGPNKLTEGKKRGLFLTFLSQFANPLIYILFVASAIVFYTGETSEGFIILVVLFFNATVGTIQEGRAQNTFWALKKFLKTSATVIRGGKEIIISDEEVVEGDIVALKEGDKVPADARVIHAESLSTDESSLTGESNPKFKITEAMSGKDFPAAEQKNMVFKGTNVVSGNGRAVVVATSEQTVIGGISKEILGIDEELPLKEDTRRLARFISLAVLSLSAALFALGVGYGHSMREIFSTVVAIAVSIIPEGLPVVVTLVLATGVWRMEKHNVLIKRLQAVEALGQIRVIATDKTGTITKNELTVKEIFVHGKLFTVSGDGYAPEGEISFGGKPIESLNHPEILLIGKIGALCSNSSLAYSNEEKKWRVSGDPTEAATSVLAKKIGFHKEDLEKELPRIDEIAFDYKLKYHATLHAKRGGNFLAVVGAPESVIKRSENIQLESGEKALGKEERKDLESVFHGMSRKGLRVLALAVGGTGEQSRIPDKISSLTFIGFLGVRDEMRREVPEAVRRVEAAGIQPVMVTGDYILTAKAIGTEAGIYRAGDRTIDGAEMENMSEKELSEKLDKVSLFARVTPEQKLKIINAYKLRGETIAMTGDGVNDALSLTAADVGVAMGQIGTEVAKEASDIVLLDDNFGSIVSGVEEGKNIYKTIKRVILYLFSSSLGELLAIVGAIILGFPLPILAVQILWLNLVTDGFLDMALAMEPKVHLTSRAVHGPQKTSLIDRRMIERMLLMGTVMAVGTLLLFKSHLGEDIYRAWTVSLTTLAVFQWLNAWNCRSDKKSVFSINPFSNKYLVGATIFVILLQFLAIYAPAFQRILKTVPLGLREWMIILATASSIIIFEEARKLIARRSRIPGRF